MTKLAILFFISPWRTKDTDMKDTFRDSPPPPSSKLAQNRHGKNFIQGMMFRSRVHEGPRMGDVDANKPKRYIPSCSLCPAFVISICVYILPSQISHFLWEGCRRKCRKVEADHSFAGTYQNIAQKLTWNSQTDDIFHQPIGLLHIACSLNVCFMSSVPTLQQTAMQLVTVYRFYEPCGALSCVSFDCKYLSGWAT